MNKITILLIVLILLCPVFGCQSSDKTGLPKTYKGEISVHEWMIKNNRAVRWHDSRMKMVLFGDTLRTCEMTFDQFIGCFGIRATSSESRVWNYTYGNKDKWNMTLIYPDPSAKDHDAEGALECEAELHDFDCPFKGCRADNMIPLEDGYSQNCVECGVKFMLRYWGNYEGAEAHLQWETEPFGFTKYKKVGSSWILAETISHTDTPEISKDRLIKIEKQLDRLEIYLMRNGTAVCDTIYYPSPDPDIFINSVRVNEYIKQYGCFKSDFRRINILIPAGVIDSVFTRK